MSQLVTVGGAAFALAAILTLVVLVAKGGAMLVRIHDNIMGDGNGRKPLRELLERTEKVIENHTRSDEREFERINAHLNAQDIEVRQVAATAASAAAAAAAAAAGKEQK